MYNFQILVFLIIVSTLFSWFYIFPKSKPAGVGYVYMSTVCLVNVFYPEVIFSGHPQSLIKEMSLNSMTGYLYMTSVFAFVFMLSRKWIEILMDTIRILAVLMVLVCSVKWVMGKPASTLMLNTSMEGSFFAIVSCIFIREAHFWRKYNNKREWFVIAVQVMACVFTTSSVGIGGIFMAISLYFFLRAENLKTHLIISGILSAIIAVFYVGPEKFFNDSLRFICWEWSLKWWYENASILTGTGVGTFFKLGPWIQMVNVDQACALNPFLRTAPISASAVCEAAKNFYQYGNWYTFAHNDWLQLLIEGGIIGVLVALWAFFDAIVKAQGRIWVTVGILVYATVSFMNMPAHYLLTAIVGLLILRVSSDKELANL